ncbi:T9SS type A sorting domain-containing protein [candidate division KSB1 bacterium]|nr:T9SS type A sorting domain-containing protein [candidate division KSB1 bacterium]
MNHCYVCAFLLILSFAGVSGAVDYTITITPTAQQQVTEGDALPAATVEFQITCSPAPPGYLDWVNVSFDISGAARPLLDFMRLEPPLLNSVTFRRNQTTKTIRLAIVPDQLVEGDEALTITLTGASTRGGSTVTIASNAGSCVILDDDQANLMIQTREIVHLDGSPVVGMLQPDEDYIIRIGVQNLGGSAVAMNTVGVVDQLPPELAFVRAYVNFDIFGYSGEYDLSSGYDPVSHTWSFQIVMPLLNPLWPAGDERVFNLQVHSDPELIEGQQMTNFTQILLNAQYVPGNPQVPDPELGNNEHDFVMGVQTANVDRCIDIDSDCNVGLAPLCVHFHLLKPFALHEWSFYEHGRIHGADPLVTFWQPDGLPNKNHGVQFNDEQFDDFVTVYPAGGYSRLQLVAAGPSIKDSWPNAIDGDTYWDNGSAWVQPDASGAAWAIFEFIDQGRRDLESIRLMTDTGIGHLAQQAIHFQVWVSTSGTDAADFSLLLDAEKNNTCETPCDLNDDWMSWDVAAADVRYIKLVVLSPFESGAALLGEFEVYTAVTLPEAAQSWIDVTHDGSHEPAELALHLLDADGQPLTGKTFHDVRILGVPLYGDPNQWIKATDFSATADPGVYRAFLRSDARGEFMIKASVNGCIVDRGVEGEVRICFGEQIEPGQGSSAAANTLVLVKGSETYKSFSWDKLVDGLSDGWNGTTWARGSGDPEAPAWAIYRFGDDGLYRFNLVTLQTDNGPDDDAYSNQVLHFEVWVSQTGLQPADFACVLKTNRRGDGSLIYYRLNGDIVARYVMVKFITPSWEKGSWRQAVEFGVDTAEKRGAVPAGSAIDFRSLPDQFALMQNYPNPFNASTSITYSLLADAQVELAIYDISGAHVATLVDAYQPAGTHSVRWSAGDWASGTYFCRLRAAGQIFTRTLVLIK